LAEPPASPPGGTGHHQEFTPRNVLDLAITRELIDHGLSTRRIRNILALWRDYPYHEEDQKGAIERRVARVPAGTTGLAPSDVSYDYLVIYPDRPERTRYVGRATGEGTRWWKEKAPKSFHNEFVSQKLLMEHARRRDSLTAVNVARLRRIVFDAANRAR
jgi:DNA-binding transcriptional MerR regulator